MTVIWRYPVEPGVRDFFVSVPRGSRFMKCVVKDGEPQLYFRINDPKAEPADVMFFVVPTGVELTELEQRGVYIDTFVINEPGGSLAFHLFIEATNA